MKKILVVEDDAVIRENILELLSNEGFEAQGAGGGDAAIKLLRERRPDLVICDIMMPEGDGYSVLAALRADAATATVPLIFLTAKADRTEVRTGMNLGADDYVTKPFTRVELLASIHTRLDRIEAMATSFRSSQLEKERQKDKDAADGARASWPEPCGVVVEDPAMRALYEQATRIAKAPISVLLRGQTGVGKEILALEIHRRSKRAAGPFLAINCAALAENLLESELFGHEKGAFTGALTQQKGLFESAEGGTLFLDEMGDLPMATQVKLLRVIEDRKVLRVGSRTPRPIDVRFISATHKDLEAGIEQGTFRQDLYFRLNGVSLFIPPLCERVSEIAGLASVFIDIACRESNRARAPALSGAALAALERYAWPGNVRELRKVIELAVALCDGDQVEVEHLDPKVLERGPPASGPRGDRITPVSQPSPPVAASPPAGSSTARLKEELWALERQRIIDAFEQCGWNGTKAAVLLGMARRTLISRQHEYGIQRPGKRLPSNPGDDEDGDL